jgi:hypothetical protein
MPKGYTSRGFVIYDEFEGSNGGIRVRESSSAEEVSVWIFQNGRYGFNSIHLNYEEANRVVSALMEFLNEYERDRE